MSETPVHRLERLLAALDTLVAQEAMLIASAAWDEVREVQKRIRAVVDVVAPLAVELNGDGRLPLPLRRRTEAILARQRSTVEHLQKSQTRTEAQLRALSSTKARLNVVRPAYTRAHGRDDGRAFAAHG